MHDFVDKELGKAIPYGVYDIGANVGCVSVGINHDTVNSVENVRIPCCDMEPPNRLCHSNSDVSLSGGGTASTRFIGWWNRRWMLVHHTPSLPDFEWS